MDYQSMDNEQLEQLVAQKNGPAICEMAQRCLMGSKGVQQNYTRAYQLYHKGEKLGLKEAYLGLAQMYEQGIGLAKNQRLADMYRNMTGEDRDSIPIQPVQTRRQMESVEPMTEAPPSSLPSPQDIITVDRLAAELNRIEEVREGGYYSEAKQLLRQFFDMLSEVQNGRRIADANVDIKMWQVNASQLLGHICYLEGDYQNAENAFRQRGVLEMYPGVAYLIATIHKAQGCFGQELESDMVLLQAAEANTLLNDKERGDVLGRMADLYLLNIGVQDGNGMNLAYHYYSQAATLGNDYARMQLEKFRVMPSGELQYMG